MLGVQSLFDGSLEESKCEGSRRRNSSRFEGDCGAILFGTSASLVHELEGSGGDGAGMGNRGEGWFC